MKYGTIIPLIGGMTLGNRECLGKDPEVLLSFNDFAENDKYIRDYLPNVAYYNLDDENSRKRFHIVLNYDEPYDFISSVCPCAGLTCLTTSEDSYSSREEDEEASHNEWMYKCCQYVLGAIKPRCYWGENAPGLFLPAGSAVVSKLREIGKQCGYHFTGVRTDAQLHGLPQVRKRSFYFFFKEGSPFMEFSNNQSDITYEQLLQSVPSSHPYYSKNFAEYIAAQTVESTSTNPGFRFMFETFGDDYYNKMRKYVRKSANFSALFNALRDDTSLYESWKTWLAANGYLDHLEFTQTKKWWSKSFWEWYPKIYYDTIGAFQSRLLTSAVHPTQKRGINYAEGLALMGMPLDFKLYKFHPRHLSQNVPVNSAKYWTQQVVNALEGKVKFSKDSMIIDNIDKKYISIDTNKELCNSIVNKFF